MQLNEKPKNEVMTSSLRNVENHYVISILNHILVVLFDALTEFLKKQALKGANEIIGYYSKKYKTYHHGTGMKGPGIHEPLDQIHSY